MLAHHRPVTDRKLNPDITNPYVWVQMEYVRGSFGPITAYVGASSARDRSQIEPRHEESLRIFYSYFFFISPLFQHVLCPIFIDVG